MNTQAPEPSKRNPRARLGQGAEPLASSTNWPSGKADTPENALNIEGEVSFPAHIWSHFTRRPNLLRVPWMQEARMSRYKPP